MTRRQTIAVAVGGLAVSVVVLVAAVAMATRADTAAPPRQLTGPTLTPAEAAFFDQVARHTELETRGAEVIVMVGRQICANIGRPGLGRLGVLQAVRDAYWGDDSVVLVMAAEEHLCPEKDYVTPIASPTVGVR